MKKLSKAYQKIKRWENKIEKTNLIHKAIGRGFCYVQVKGSLPSYLEKYLTKKLGCTIKRLGPSEYAIKWC